MEVICFDFDGVICDSAPETALAAWNASRAIWPGEEKPLPEALQQRFCALRPVLHTGFEAVPLMRLIADGEVDDARILAEFPALRDEFIERESLTGERLKEVFGAARDRLIEQDRKQWLKWNRFYPDVDGILAAAIQQHQVFIITTKQERFVALLLNHNEIELPTERIFGLERNLSKPEILAELMGRVEHQGAAFHFIEDRLDTLNRVMEKPALRQVRLYLVDWGYNTAAQRREAAESERIKVVSRDAREPAGDALAFLQ